MTSTTEWQDADRQSIDAWLNLHLIARRLPAGEDSRVLADVALARVIPLAAELPEHLRSSACTHPRSRRRP